MKKIIFIWQVPFVSGVPYGPLIYLIFVSKAKKYVKFLEETLKSISLEWKIYMDDTAADMEGLKQKEADLYIVVPEGSTRGQMYLCELDKCNVPIYYLSSDEYGKNNTEKIIDFISSIK